MEWFNEVHESLGAGMENNLDAKNMRKILSYSYYDLPSHLKTCFLYLIMVLEDFVIDKESLIWLWRAEGFIQHKEDGKSQFEIGESYFYELINRSLIQHVPGPKREAYRVHDMILDLLCSLSGEENFVSILNGGNHISAPTTTRRLSVQIQGTHLSFPKLRSAIFFASVLDAPSFSVLRVQVLHDCKLGKGHDLKYLRNLFHLRYLGLSGTGTEELPEEIANLQFLETLNIRESKFSCCLPSSIVQLRKLISISSSYIATRIPNGIGNLRPLEHLSWLLIDYNSMDHIEGLGLLTELRVLRILLFTGELNDKLVGSLLKLRKIECLEIDCGSGQRNIGGLDDWVAPQHLRVLRTAEICWFSRLPM